MKRGFFIAIIGVVLSFPVLRAQETGIPRKSILDEETSLPFENSIHEIEYDYLGSDEGKIEVTVLDKNIVHLKITFTVEQPLQQDDWQLTITPGFSPSFHWAPHLTPTADHIIDQHLFRSPALILSDSDQVLTLIPDLDIMQKGTAARWYLDMDAANNRLALGMSNSNVAEHVLFRRAPGASYPEGSVEIGFYLMHHTDKSSLENPFRAPLHFLWSRWGHSLYKTGNPLDGSLDPYVDHTYNWAFNSWGDAVWQEFILNGRKVGAPVFIVNVTQSPNYPGEVNEREFRSVWNQAWFSSLRSASGLYRYARRHGNDRLLEKARMTRELALSFPQQKGFFYGLIGTGMEEVEIEGRKYNRSKGWENYYWGNSNRNPYTWNPGEAPFHILDMSWTALLMLRWYDELEKDIRLLHYAEEYAKSLLKIQYTNGFFPGWLDIKSLEPMDHLNDSPETSMSVTFLLKMFELTGNEAYRQAALRAMDAVIRHVIPEGRWEDFETYWSCSRYGSDSLVGKKVRRNNMFKQNNFSMFWTAEALMEAYRITGERDYLTLGERTLDELLMTQASWQPPYMYVNVLGGFGVMNADGEWNDSRQSLFAGLILRYGRLLEKQEYRERGIAALKASFVMMYAPENPVTRLQWEKVYPFFGEADFGFTMENYGHGGVTTPEGEGMGEFTIYDWGNGAAAEAYSRILDHFPEVEEIISER